MPQRIVAKRLKFSYISAATIIGVLALLVQIIIQTSLYQEVQTRNLASVMSLQELHSQHFLRNSLMTFDPGNMVINPLKIDPFQQIRSDLTFLETTNKRLLDSSVTPQPIVQQIDKLQPDFIIMDKAGYQLLLDAQKHDKKDQAKQVTLIFIYEQSYLSGVYAGFLILTQQADSQVTNVILLELTLCCVTLITITVEARLVVIPAFKDLERIVLQKIQAKQEVSKNMPN